MDFAPPPSPGSRIQELGDDLIVRFRPRPNWAVIVFAAIWLAVFAVGVIPDYPDTLTGNEWWELPFAIAGCVLMLIVGLVLPVVWIAWQFFGEITLTVTPERIEVRKCIGKVSRTKRYDPKSVRDVRAAPVLGGEDNDIPRGDFGLELVRGKKSVFVGEGMGEREADGRPRRFARTSIRVGRGARPRTTCLRPRRPLASRALACGARSSRRSSYCCSCSWSSRLCATRAPGPR